MGKVFSSEGNFSKFSIGYFLPTSRKVKYILTFLLAVFLVGILL